MADAFARRPAGGAGDDRALCHRLAAEALRAVCIFYQCALIGHGGLNYVPEFAATEVLWALHPDAWGKGYATETARAATDYGFEALGLASIFAITKLDNLASQAVTRRLGLTYRRNDSSKNHLRLRREAIMSQSENQSGDVI